MKKRNTTNQEKHEEQFKMMERRPELTVHKKKISKWPVNIDKVVNIISHQGTANKTIIKALHIH